MEYREYVDAVSDAVRSLEYGDMVVVQPVTPWGSFTTALNAALRHAVDTGHSRILYQVFLVDTIRTLVMTIILIIYCAVSRSGVIGRRCGGAGKLFG